MTYKATCICRHIDLVTPQIHSLCINIAPGTSVTACKGRASGKEVHISSGLRPWPPVTTARAMVHATLHVSTNSYKKPVASSGHCAYCAAREEFLWTAYTWSSVGPNMKWPCLRSGESVVKCFSFICSCLSRFSRLADQSACERERQIPLRECALK